MTYIVEQMYPNTEIYFDNKRVDIVFLHTDDRERARQYAIKHMSYTQQSHLKITTWYMHKLTKESKLKIKSTDIVLDIRLTTDAERIAMQKKSNKRRIII